MVKKLAAVRRPRLSPLERFHHKRRRVVDDLQKLRDQCRAFYPVGATVDVDVCTGSHSDFVNEFCAARTVEEMNAARARYYRKFRGTIAGYSDDGITALVIAIDDPAAAAMAAFHRIGGTLSRYIVGTGSCTVVAEPSV
ncbi:MAG: hypothetical protein QM775_16540 [Pirellulales bacterium]